MLYNFVQCGGSIDEFDRMTVGSVIDFIMTWVQMREKATKQNSKRNNNTEMKQGETVTYGKIDEETYRKQQEEFLKNGEGGYDYSW